MDSSSLIRSRLLLLVSILAAIVVVATALAVYALYRTSYEQTRQRLVEIARSRARLIEAVARFDERSGVADTADGALAATLSQIRAAHERFRGFGETGEYTLAQRRGDAIVFTLRHRHGGGGDDEPASVPWDAAEAEPMRRALSARSGTVVGPDYRGVTVLAAHEPVDAHGLGLVAKIDLAEVRAPYVRVGVALGLAAFALVLVGGALFHRVSRPVVRELERQNAALLEEIERRERADVSLQRSEEQFRTLFEAAPIGVAFVDAEGRPFRTNPALREIVGYTAEELAGMRFTEFTHPDDADIDWMLYQQLLAGERESYRIEKRYLHKDGHVVWASLALGMVRDADGTPLFPIGMVADQTEQRRAEAALRESEEGLRATLMSIGDAVIATDAAGVVTRVNPVAERLTGWPAAAAVGRPLDEVFRIITEESRRPVESPAARVLREGSVVGLANHTLLLARDGRELPVADSGAPIRGGDGAITGVVLVFRDQSDERAAEEALRRSERQYRLLAENTLDVIWTMDLDLTFTYVNPAITALTGHTPAEWIGSRLADHADEANLARMAEVVAEEVAGGAGPAGRTFEAELRRKDGTTVPVEIRGRVSCDADGTPVRLQGVTRDISERRRAERAQAALSEQLGQAQKLESIGRLAGGVAHDFNNLLTVISNYGDLLAEDLGAGSPLRDDVEEIRQAAARATDLTRQLLAFSRRQIIRPEVIDINATVERSERMLRRLIGEDVALRFVPEPALWRTKVDPGQIEQILFNLAVNSRDAMPDGGRLTLETQNVTLDDGYLETHPEAQAGRHVVLAVSDTGTGMDETTRRNAFEPFFTTKGVGKGTGLGLSTVHGIVKQHGGSIELYSEPGVGTTFKIFLPACEGALAAADERSEKTAPVGDRTILVVEDESAVRRVAVRILRSHGYRVIETGSAREAIEMCRDPGVTIDLVLADVVMPEMSGRACYEAMAAIRPGLRVLYMSGYTENAIAHHGVLEDGTAFVQKPFTVESLAEKVRRAIAA